MTTTTWTRPPYYLAAAPDGDRIVVWASLRQITASHPMEDGNHVIFGHCATGEDVEVVGDRLIKDATWQRMQRCDVI